MDTSEEPKSLLDTAKEVAGKTVGRYGLSYITFIVLVAVVASYYLQPGAMTAVMTMVGAVLMAIIQMMHGVTGTPPKTEFLVIQQLIDKLERIADKREPPMNVRVEDDQVQIQHGDNTIVAARNHYLPEERKLESE